MPEVALLLDECLPVKLKYRFQEYDRDLNVSTVRDQGWTGIKNGRLLELAQKSFDVIVTVDRKMSFQQNVSAYAIGVIAIRIQSNRYKDLITSVPAVADLCSNIIPGEVQFVQSSK